MSDNIINKVKELSQMKEAFKVKVTKELRDQIPVKKEEIKALIDDL